MGYSHPGEHCTQISVTLSPELTKALDLYRGRRRLSLIVEELLWSSPGIQKAADLLGLERPVRREDGRMATGLAVTPRPDH